MTSKMIISPVITRLTRRSVRTMSRNMTIISTSIRIWRFSGRPHDLIFGTKFGGLEGLNLLHKISCRLLNFGYFLLLSLGEGYESFYGFILFEEVHLQSGISIS